MADWDWVPFLQRWGREMLASPRTQGLPDEAKATGWLGFQPASEEQIADAERWLKIRLPPSYRTFLSASNGWGRTTHAIGQLWGTQQINWFRKAHRDWITAYTPPTAFGPREETPDAEYYAYGKHAEHFKPAHLKETLQISEVGDSAVYLLNPQVISKDGEWEAWFLANWLPGVHRYRSFAELMQAQYHQFAGMEWRQPSGVMGELPDEYIGAPGSPKRRIKKRSKPREPKVLGRAISKWTVDELLSFLKNPAYDIIYGEICWGLGKMGDPRAIEPLLAMLPEKLAVVSALRTLAPGRLREPLLQLLDRQRAAIGPLHGIVAILAELGENRAIPILVDMMKDNRPEASHAADSVGMLIAQFGKAGFEALVEQLGSGDPGVRQRAVIGLLSTNRAEARDVLSKLVNDPDPRIRETAQSAIEVLPRKRG